MWVTALFGLLGVAIGAVLTTWGSFALQRRMERGAAYVATEFIRRDLLAARLLLEETRGGMWWAAEDSPQFPGWEAHGSALFVGRIKGGREAFRAVSHALKLVNNLSAQVTAKHRLIQTKRELARERLGALSERADEDLDLEPDQTPEAAREAQKQAIQDASEREIRKLAEAPADDEALDRAIRALATAGRSLPSVPGDEGRAWSVRRRVAAGAAALLVLAVAAIAAISIVQSLQSPYTANSIAAAVKQTRSAQLASCDKNDEVDGSWTCQLAYADNPATCKQELRSEAPAPLAVASSSSSLAQASCRIRELEMTEEMQQGQLHVLGRVGKRIDEDGKTHAAPPPEARIETVKDRRTLLDRILGRNK